MDQSVEPVSNSTAIMATSAVGTITRNFRRRTEGMQLVNKRQVFVSYAHADNQQMDTSIAGWVTLFVERLQWSVARQSGGAQVAFWMDHRLEPQRRVDDELRTRIQESAVILSLISPRYMESDWCQREMATFVQEVGGGHSDNRVFMVELLPTERERWHPAVRSLSPLFMWTRSLTHPEPKTKGWPAPDPRGDRAYWDDLNQLAAVLTRQLMLLPRVSAQMSSTCNSIAPDTESLGTTIQPPKSELGNLAASPLRIIIKAAEDEDPQLVAATQALLADLDADAYLAPPITPGQLPSEHRLAAEAQLRDSHAVLVVYGVAPITWVQAKHADLRKVLAYERKGIWAGLLEGPPAPKPGHGLPPRGLIVLDCKDGLRKDEIARFVQAVRGASQYV